MTGLEYGLSIAFGVIYGAGMALMFLFGYENGMWREIRPKYVSKDLIVATMVIGWGPVVLIAMFWGIGSMLKDAANMAMVEWHMRGWRMWKRE